MDQMNDCAHAKAKTGGGTLACHAKPRTKIDLQRQNIIIAAHLTSAQQ
jgi:hypothetical protein